VEYGDFDLSEFRWHAAALIRYLIQAREKSDPGFLGAPDVYRSWNLENISQDRESQLELLGKGLVSARLVWADMQAMGGSGGVRLDDPLQGLKSMIAAFAYEAAIEEAIAANRHKRRIVWNELADWENLATIRNGLDMLPAPDGTAIRPPLAFENAPLAQSPRVVLFPRGHQPAAIIDNEFIERITSAQHDVVLALLRAGQAGLPKKLLVEKSGRGDAVKILKRLADSSPAWARVIDRPGIPGCGYRIN
jgi:hypothetical protein